MGRRPLHVRIHELEQRLNGQKLSGLHRTALQARMFVLLLAFALHRAMHVLFTPAQHSFHEVHYKPGSDTYTHSYNQHVQFQKGMRFLSASSFLVPVVASVLVFSVLQVFDPLQQGPRPAHAAQITFDVTNTNASGAGSLDAQVTAALAAYKADPTNEYFVDITVSGTVTTTSSITVDAPIVIQNSSGGDFIYDGDDSIGGVGFLFTTGSTGAKLERVTVNDWDVAVSLQEDGIIVNENKIRSSGSGVEIEDSNDHIILNNLIDEVTVGVNTEPDSTSSSDVTVRDNTIGSNTLRGTSGIQTDRTTDWVISGNTISNFQHAAIDLSNDTGTTITGNNFTLFFEQGVDVGNGSSNVTIGSEAAPNYFYNSSTHSIYIQSNVTGLTVDSNVFGSDSSNNVDGSVAGGISSGGSGDAWSGDVGLVVQNNTFANISDGDGVVLDAGGSDITVQNNTFGQYPNGADGAGGSDGIRIGGDTEGFSILGNTFFNMASKGVAVIGTGNGTVTQNTVFESEQIGIMLDGAQDVVASGNYIGTDSKGSPGSTGDGFLLKNASDFDDWNTTISGNTVANASGDGIWLEDDIDNVTISGNTLDSINEDGIEIDTASSNITISTNTFEGVGGEGLAINSNAQNITIEDNFFQNGQDDGIQIKDTAVNTVITGNLFSNNAKDGITVDGDPEPLTISGNTFMGNGDNAIELWGGATEVTISNNYIGIDDEGTRGPHGSSAIGMTSAQDVSITGNWFYNDTQAQTIHLSTSSVQNVSMSQNYYDLGSGDERSRTHRNQHRVTGGTNGGIQAPTITATDDSGTTGTATAGATVEAYIDGVYLGTTTANGAGVWTVTATTATHPVHNETESGGVVGAFQTTTAGSSEFAELRSQDDDDEDEEPVQDDEPVVKADFSYLTDKSVRLFKVDNQTVIPGEKVFVEDGNTNLALYNANPDHEVRLKVRQQNKATKKKVTVDSTNSFKAVPATGVVEQNFDNGLQFDYTVYGKARTSDKQQKSETKKIARVGVSDVDTPVLTSFENDFMVHTQFRRIDFAGSGSRVRIYDTGFNFLTECTGSPCRVPHEAPGYAQYIVKYDAGHGTPAQEKELFLAQPVYDNDFNLDYRLYDPTRITAGGTVTVRGIGPSSDDVTVEAWAGGVKTDLAYDGAINYSGQVSLHHLPYGDHKLTVKFIDKETGEERILDRQIFAFKKWPAPAEPLVQEYYSTYYPSTTPLTLIVNGGLGNRLHVFSGDDLYQSRVFEDIGDPEIGQTTIELDRSQLGTTTYSMYVEDRFALRTARYTVSYQVVQRPPVTEVVEEDEGGNNDTEEGGQDEESTTTGEDEGGNNDTSIEEEGDTDTQEDEDGQEVEEDEGQMAEEDDQVATKEEDLDESDTNEEQGTPSDERAESEEGDDDSELQEESDLEEEESEEQAGNEEQETVPVGSWLPEGVDRTDPTAEAIAKLLQDVPADSRIIIDESVWETVPQAQPVDADTPATADAVYNGLLADIAQTLQVMAVSTTIDPVTGEELTRGPADTLEDGTALLQKTLLRGIQPTALTRPIERPLETGTIVYYGETEPSALLLVDMRSRPYIVITRAGTTGEWNAEIPIDALEVGDHAATIRASHRGIITDPVEVTEVAVTNESRLSSTTWAVIIAVSTAVILLLLLIALTGRRKKQPGEVGGAPTAGEQMAPVAQPSDGTETGADAIELPASMEESPKSAHEQLEDAVERMDVEQAENDTSGGTGKRTYAPVTPVEPDNTEKQQTENDDTS